MPDVMFRVAAVSDCESCSQFRRGLHRILFDDLEQPVAGGIGGRTAVISTEPRL